LGSVYRDQGRLSDATEALESACQLLEQSTSMIDAAKANLQLASTLFLAGLRSLALHHLQRVADIVRTVGHDRFILPLVARERTLIQYALAKGRSQGPLSEWLARAAAYVPRKARRARPGETVRTVEIRALGGFTVLIDDMPVSDLAWQTTKAKEMFLYLAVKGGPVLKEEIVEALWPDLPSTKSSSYFHSNLHRVRRALYQRCVVRDGPRYLLDPEGSLKQDVHAFSRAADRCRRGETAIEALRQAASLYSGPFAPEIYSDWATDLRTNLEDQYLWVLRRLLEQTLRSGDRAETPALCQKILDVDAFDEAAWREFIQYCRDEGHLGLSMRLYRRCTDVFVGQLGTEVPPAIGELIRLA